MMRTAIANKARTVARRGERNARELTQVLACVGTAGLMALLTRAMPLGGGAPFALGCFVAGLFTGKSRAALLIGCFLGSPWEIGSVQAFAPLLGCLFALGAHALLKRMAGLEADGPTSMQSRDLLAASVAGAAMLFSRLPFVHELQYDLMMALINATLAVACAPTMISALSMNMRRTRLLSEEQVSLMLFALATLIGLRGLPALGEPLSHLLVGVLTLLGARCSVGAGAAFGVLGGSMLTLMGDSPYIGAAMALCGVFAGSVKRLGRPAMSLAFVMGNAISLIYTSGEQIGVFSPLVALLAGVSICFLPGGIERRLVGWFTPSAQSMDSDRMLARLRQDAEKRVRAMGLLFEEMSVGYETPSPLPDEQTLVMKMRAKLCEGCSNYEHCWSGDGQRASRLLVELLSDALCGRVIDAGVDKLPPDVCRKCRRANQIPKRLGPMLSQFDEQRRAARERGECKALLSSQFHQASEALMMEGEKLARPLHLDKDLASRVGAALDREGLCADAVWAVEDDLPQLFVGLKDKLWNRAIAGKAARGLSNSLGIQMKPLSMGECAQDELCFVPAPRMSVDVGFAGRAGVSGTLSGDSHLTGALGDGRVLLALSDGMGSGQRAAAESASALRLLKRFLSAGVPCSMALEAINELLLLRSGDEMFATADLCVLDLSSCRAEFSKLGGCASLILRKDRMIRIEGGRLPLGVLNKVSPITSKIRLQQGDLVVMVTDGVLDASHDGQLEWLEAQVRRYKLEPPQKLCERLVTAAAARPGCHKDDITALVAKIGAS